MSKKHDDILKHLINTMFSKAGHDVTYEDIKDRKDNWFQQYTITNAQHDEWVEESVVYLKKKLRYPIVSCRKEMCWFSLMYGLKISDHEG